MFRGADKHVLNRTMFDAHRVASISQHKRIADLIEAFQEKDVGNVLHRLVFFSFCFRHAAPRRRVTQPSTIRGTVK